MFSDHVIEGDVLISGISAKFLLESGSSHSFNSPKFASQLGVNPVVMDAVIDTKNFLQDWGRIKEDKERCKIPLQKGESLKEWVFLRIDSDHGVNLAETSP